MVKSSMVLPTCKQASKTNKKPGILPGFIRLINH